MKNSLNKDERRLLAHLMIQQNLSLADLALKMSVNYRHLANQSSLGFPSQTMQRKIEQAFGICIFTAPDEYNRRAELKTLFGFDPFQETNSTLRNFASDKGIFIGQAWRKPKIIEVITAALTARENPTTPTK